MKDRNTLLKSTEIYYIFNGNICNFFPNILYVELTNLFTNKTVNNTNRKIYNKFKKIIEPYNIRFFKFHLPINIFNKLLVVNLNETKPLNIKDSIFERECFACGKGLIIITRNLPTSLNLNQHTHCVLCGQQYLIKDINKYD